MRHAKCERHARAAELSSTRKTQYDFPKYIEFHVGAAFMMDQNKKQRCRSAMQEPVAPVPSVMKHRSRETRKGVIERRGLLGFTSAGRESLDLNGAIQQAADPGNRKAVLRLKKARRCS